MCYGRHALQLPRPALSRYLILGGSDTNPDEQTMPKRLVSRTRGLQAGLQTMADCAGPRTGRSIAGTDRFADREERLGDEAMEESGAPFDGMAKSTHCFERSGTAVAVGTTLVGRVGE